MKNIFIILFFLLDPVLGKSYTWQSFCPDSIHANNIYFGAGSAYGVISSPTGMYLWEEDIQQWTFIPQLVINGAAWFNSEKILVLLGGGSYSDGIYAFDLETHQLELVEWVFTPTFITIVPVLDKKTNQFTDEYHVGSQFDGLYRSIDGLTWTEVPYFTGKACTAMDFYGEHLVVSEVSNIINIHCSDDYGATWHEAASATLITDLKFNNAGELYGIFPDYSNSSGLYKSEDFGNNWEVEFWSDNMSSVGFDAMGTIFVGWDSLAGGNKGIAIYDPLAPPPGLTFMNNGLASTNINKILMNPAMSAIAIFCCTDSGVYMCNDYMVGEYEIQTENKVIRIFPNPVTDEMLIQLNLAESNINNIEVLNCCGLKVDEIKFENHPAKGTELKWNKGNLPSGVYYLVLRTENETFTEKFIIL